MDRRHYPRITVADVQTDISDGKGFVQGTVENISRSGLLIDDIPGKIDSQCSKFFLVVNCGRKSCKLSVIPKWIHRSGSKARMGVKILDAPWEWFKYVMDLEPQDTVIRAAVSF
ncbi:PilZ domain-containing protein [Desulforhopalus singaporensis]|uniref:PilZ domain-containing protein n=1 Tax=Desulforhopalus singaporensis TaxID=91360 RepID=A0A1H0MGA2_9BACT|nr:PilZ domain-containing protein [Desulforhopalus singaporensis]SDO79371.1 hypothetical protein SAMN05660330_01035 [Desulforhopalus singaporensis]